VPEMPISYTHYLNEVQSGNTPNLDIPFIAKEYWNLSEEAKLEDLIQVVRADECKHRDVNHNFANKL
jgi:ubiquinol oxidase